VGFLGMPRRVVIYENSLQWLNVWGSVSAFVLGASMLVFVANLAYSMLLARQPEADNPWESQSLEWQLATPVPVHNFDRQPVVTGTPYEYGVPDAPPVADVPPGQRARPAGAGASP
jgi:heme/copper-type cytochrome/quinol oxidase subunit 1